MFAIQATLKPGDVHLSVANLQLALIFLFERGVVKFFDPPMRPTAEDLKALAEKIQSEQSVLTFGDATEQLVRYFQIQQGLGDHLLGVVEETTAKQLNELLVQAGVLFESVGYVVKGRVTDASGKPQSGLTVMAFDRDLRRHQKLGEAVTDANGFYDISYSIDSFQTADGNAPMSADLFVIVVAVDDKQPLVTSEVIYQAKVLETIDLRIPVTDQSLSEFDAISAKVLPLLKGQGTPRLVMHLVADPTSVDLLPYELNADDIAFVVRETGLDHSAVWDWARSAVLLRDLSALQSTDTLPMVQDALNASGWPFLFGWSRAGLSTGLMGLLSSGQERWNASLQVSQTRGWISPLPDLQSHALFDALKYLSVIASLDPAYAGDPAFAAVSARSTGLPASVALGAMNLYREKGLSGLSDFDQLAEGDPKLVQGLSVLATNLRVYELADGDVVLMQPLLKRLDGAVEGLEPFASLSKGDWVNMVEQVELDHETVHNKAAILQLKIEQLYPAIALQARIANKDVIFDGYDAGELGAMIETNFKEVNALVHGVELDDKTGFVADNPWLASQIRNLGRWVKVGAGLEAGNVLIQQGFTSPGVLTNFGPNVIDIILPNLPPAVREIITGQLSQFQRDIVALLSEGKYTYRPPVGVQPGQPPTPKLDLAPPLVQGMSAPTLRGMFGDLDECGCRSCESVLGQGAYLVDLLNLLKREVLRRGTSGTGLQSGLDILRSRRPDILNLELSCNNEELQLPHIDLALEAMEWLATRSKFRLVNQVVRPIPDWFQPQLDPKLLALIQQTCEKKLGELQSLVDASNPRLWRVADDTHTWLIEVRDSSQIMKFSVNDMSIRHTEAAPDPRLESANRNPTAYILLGEAIYPWNLPFNLSAVESQLFLERLKLPRRNLLQLLAATTDAAYIDEVLGFLPLERTLVGTPRTGDLLWQIWGFANAGPTTVVDPESDEQLVNQTPRILLQRVSILLERSGLDLFALESVLASRFVGGFALTERYQCKTSLMRVTPVMSPEALDRLHRFVRLMRKLGNWSSELVDSAVFALNPLPAPSALLLDAEVLAGFAAIHEASGLLGLPVEEVLSLRTALSSVMVRLPDQRETVSMFAAAFLSNRLAPSARELFAAVSVPGTSLTVKIIDELDAVAAALSENSSVVAQCVLMIPSAIGRTISHDTLTWLKRHLTLARALGVSVLEIRLLAMLTGLEPFGEDVAPLTASTSERTSGFKALVKFTKAAAKVAESGIPISLLANAVLLESNRLPLELGAGVELRSVDQVTGELMTLRKQLRDAEPAAQNEVAALTQQVRAVLSGFMNGETTSRVVANIADPKSVADPVSFAALTHQSLIDQDPFGIPLFATTQANELLTTPLSQLTLVTRLTQILDAVGARSRRIVLMDVMANSTGLSGPAVRRLLQSSLMIDPPVGGTTPRSALSMLNSRTFWDASDTEAIDPSIIRWAKRLDRLVALFKGCNLALALRFFPDLDWSTLILPVGSTNSALWSMVLPLLDYRWLAQSSQLSEAVLVDHLDSTLAAGAAVNLPATVGPLATRLGLTPLDIVAMTAQTSGQAATVSLLRDPVVLRRLVELASLARPLHATADQLLVLAVSDRTQVAKIARQLLSARVGADAWPDTLTSVSDALRKQQRDALVDYLSKTTSNGSDANALYDYLLIDPQVQPCFMTTRTTQAIASVQLLIQRMLFGLEPDAMISEALRDRWSWMRSYRLWETNRKVFLYPENWLFPELRDDKSTSFRRLESTLSQGELTQERAQQVFGQFLDDVNLVCQTQTLGLFEDADAPGTAYGPPRTRRDLVMIGRSPNPPYFYYWRHCQDFGKHWMEWSPWERIELDIQGDHVMPFLHNGRLHLAWPIFHKETNVVTNVVDKYKVELAWSQFNGLSWGQVNSSRDNAPSIDRVAFEDERSGFAFRPYVAAAGTPPTIYVYRKDAATHTAVNIETPPGPGRQGISAPSRLLNLSGIDELTRLLSGRASQLDTHYFNILQFYCVRINVNAPEGYKLISIQDVLLSSEKLAWHIGERDSIFAKPIVDSLTYTAAEIRAFIADFRTYGYGGGSIYSSGSWSPNAYVALVDAILHLCSSRQFRFRAWVRLSTNSSDLLELQSTDGTFSCQFSDQFSTLALSPGQLSEPMIQAGASLGGPGHSITLRWTPLSRSIPLTATLDLESADIGRSVIQTLHFEIQDLGNTSGFASRLQTLRPFKQIQRFSLQPTGVMITQTGDGSSLDALDGTTDVWMNGFMEKDVSNQSFGLTLPKAGSSSIPVFGMSGTAQRYWIVGARLVGAATLPQTNLWYFKERDSSCLIDVSPDPSSDTSGSGIRIYPSSWTKGDTLSKSWHLAGSLPSSSSQLDDFGSAGLPTLSSSMSSAIPSAVRQGQWLFDNRLPNSGYNWEVYFHAPILIADHLSKQQKFEDAERWLRMVFDPNCVESGLPQSFLRFRVFGEMPRGQSVVSDLRSLAKAAASNPSTPNVDSIRALISQWRSQPYRPYVIGRRRHIAFLWRTVFAYLDNLLAWADSLYRRDTRESIGEAAQLYLLAARILGPKPHISNVRQTSKTSSYTDLARKWDDFANAWIDVNTPSGQLPVAKPPATGVPATNQSPAAEGLLFFCVPANEKLFTYWDLVNGRLFNIRHCRNFEGISRDLPLTDPPIDPEMLVRATSAGLNLSDVVNDLFARPLPYRYSVLIARAQDLASDVRAFGGAMLSALEKRDAEQLSQLRSTNEIDLLKRVTAVRQLQIEEAQRNLESLRVSRAGTAARFEQIQRQLGKADQRAPLEQESTGEESQLGRLASGNAVGTSKWGLIVEEQRQWEEQATAGFWTDADSVARIVGAAFSLSASIAHLIPGGTGAGQSFSALASAGGATADAFRAISQIHQTEAARQATSAAHIRRRDEWAHQSNQTLRELKQIDKQILANEIRIALTRVEMVNHENQMEQSEAIGSFLFEKFTNLELYEWMQSQLSTLHNVAYRMALDMARLAERAAAHELGVPALNVIGSDFSSSRRSGLLAGERLHQDIKRLDIAYLKQNRREYELTRHFSLARLNPVELLKLKTTGTCSLNIPEWLFDMDIPGHYMRRIKTVSLSLPCVVGPYASVNCKLTLLKHTIRISSSNVGTYSKSEEGDDSRFTENYGATESIVTSSGRDDSGLFETVLRDERYLPFESAGAISKWRLEISGMPRQFGFDTLSDVILHMRYTARDGGDDLRDAALAQFSAQNPNRQSSFPQFLLSSRCDFANDWAAAQTGSTRLKVNLSLDLLPYWMQALGLVIRGISTIPWVRDGTETPQSIKVWPAVAPLSQAGIGADGVGVADLGLIGAGVDDVLILLDVG
jgi:hypothetical protein